MASPTSPINIYFITSEKFDPQNIAGSKEFLIPILPQAAKLDPTPQEKIKENVAKLTLGSRLAHFLDQIVTVMNKVLRAIAYPTLLIGGALLLFGLSQSIFIMATTLSITALMQSQALVILIVGGILYKLGQDLKEGRDINTTLGNLAYSVPLPFYVRTT